LAELSAPYIISTKTAGPWPGFSEAPPRYKVWVWTDRPAQFDGQFDWKAVAFCNAWMLNRILAGEFSVDAFLGEESRLFRVETVA
jgi:hypothetical protein